MTDNVVRLHTDLIGDGVKIDPDDVIRPFLGKVQSVVVVGLDGDGKLIAAGSESVPESITLLERAKAMLVSGYDD